MSPAPLSVCMLGSMAAGKSTFLAGLAILGEPDRPDGLLVRGLNEPSVAYLKELGDTLRLGRWPGPTNVVNLFEIEVTAAGKVLNLLILDYPGDDFRVQLQRFVAGAAEELRARLAAAEACLLLLDPERELRPESELTDAERNQQVDRLSALVHAVADLRSKRRAAAPPGSNPKAAAPSGTAPGKPPALFPDLAVVVTKADLVPELTNPAAAEAFLRRRVPNVLKRFRENAEVVECFAVSAVGATDRTLTGEVVPAPRAKLAPRGYRELFEWLVRRRKVRRWWPWIVAAGVPIVAAGIGLIAYQGKTVVDHSQIETVLKNDSLTEMERLRSTLACPEPLRGLRRELFVRVLDRLKDDLAKAAAESDLLEIDKRAETLLGFEPASERERCEVLRGRARERRLELRFEEVGRLRDGKQPAFREFAERFLADFPADGRAERVKEWLGIAEAESFEADKQAVFRLPVTDDRSLGIKLDKIAEFLKQHGPKLGTRGAAIRRAAELGTRFRTPQDYKVFLRSTGKFLSPRRQIVKIYSGETFVGQYAAPVDATVRTWNETFAFPWKLGQSVRMELYEDGYFSDPKVATLEGTGPFALAAFSAPRDATTQTAGWDAAVEGGMIRFEVGTPDISVRRWQEIEDYLLPGEAWNRSWEAPP